MKLYEIITLFEKEAPVAYQESYDNSGLTTGNPDMEISGALLCIDITMEVLHEAIEKGANLIISHHPVIFSPIRKITGKTTVEKMLITAIQHNIALFAAHTNLDNVISGVNNKICDKLELQKRKILVPATSKLNKLVTFVPAGYLEKVRTALFEAGAGSIGNYDLCSYSSSGQGSYRPGENTAPFAGEKGKMHYEEETRLETIFPVVYKQRIIDALLKAHPYEETAYDIIPLDNQFDRVGSGMIGELPEETGEIEILHHIKKLFHCFVLRHSALRNKPVKKIAVCGGSGSFLIENAVAAGADLFVTGEIKYHQFFDAGDQIVLADMGHFESEQFTIEIFYDILIKKLPNFAIHFSRIKTSPIYYI
jgi:dinuclear metal center YbgI/SA1388 family protein